MFRVRLNVPPLLPPSLLQADLESRALETATAERDRTTADMENIEEEVKEDIKNKQERPGSRGKKESRSARKGKGDSESKSRPKPSEGDMVATTKEGRADGSGKAISTGRETSGSGQGGEKYPPIKAQGKKHDGTTGKGASESVRVIRQGLLRKGNQGKKNL